MLCGYANAICVLTHEARDMGLLCVYLRYDSGDVNRQTWRGFELLRMGDLACAMKEVFSAAILSIAGCGPWAVIVHLDAWAME